MSFLPGNQFPYNCLPSKTTHKLQLLDVGVFSPLQSAWAKHAQQCAAQRNTITRNTVVHEYMQIRAKYMTVRMITSAFCCSGMWPIDPSIFDHHDYAPTLHSSTQVTGPSLYPNYVASSPFSARATLPTNPDWVMTEPNSPVSSDTNTAISTTVVSQAHIIWHVYC